MNEAFSQLAGQYGWLLAVLVVWSLVWKGLALWHSARNSQSYWFIALLLINTLGLLEIVYMVAFSKPKQVDVVRN